ncbi:MAG: efflux RND transporter permease subunit [Planctomycetes bacterium]|nr:efflux RND transporter permease subunit [Planctomycetota bacterium]
MSEPRSLLDRAMRFCLENKFVAVLLTLFTVLGGLVVAPFDWDLGHLPRAPVAVDAIPDTGDNQQIVFSAWPGRSPQDVENQVTYPLTAALLGVPGVHSVRSTSMLGFSTIFIIFAEDIEFYWSRSRILEKLNSLPAGTLPEGVQPALGPDATVLGQVFWYTLEGRDEQGEPAPGFGPEELRSIQDWQVRYALAAAEGVSEVAPVGGFVREYQVDVDPDAMRAYGVTLAEVYEAVRLSNIDVGARTIEINQVEYVVRGLGFLKSVADLENAVIKSRDDVPVYVKNVARVSTGPALRRGALDKDGAEAVGGVVVVRFGANPLQVIKNVRAKIAEVAPGLPKKVLPDGRVSQVTIVPFYDRTGLIHETLDTLNEAIEQQIIVTVIVVLVMVAHLRSSLLISALFPLTVLLCFIGMKWLGIDANIVSLSGIAIAIGTIDDVGIVLCENMLRHLDDRRKKGGALTYRDALEVVARGSSEVGGAVLTAIATTVVSFLPVFAMTGAEGKLFKPLAWTKTLTLLGSVVIGLALIPPFAHVLFAGRIRWSVLRRAVAVLFVAAGVWCGFRLEAWVGVAVLVAGVWMLAAPLLPEAARRAVSFGANYAVAALVAVFLAKDWAPLGHEAGVARNLLFAAVLIVGILLFFRLFLLVYEPVLRWALNHKLLFLLLPASILLFGATAWLGYDTLFGFLPRRVHETRAAVWARHALPGLGREFMPPLEEGSFLWMPTTMPHASLGEALDALQKQDMAFSAIPEVETVVGKIGRVESAIDPAPVSMVETLITYKPEYVIGEDGKRVRQWRDEIRSPRDIWDEIVKAGAIPGSTSAPYLQPIETRRIMLQSGMRAVMGVKVRGQDLAAVEKACLDIERLLKEVPSVDARTVLPDRLVGKPYLEIDIDRAAIARYGVHLQMVQDVIEVAIGGKPVTMTVEGRERYPVRVRYQRELRDSVEALERILVPANEDAQIPLAQLAEIRYVRGPEMIKSEDTFLVGYVTFDKRPGFAEVDVVEHCAQHLKTARERGDLDLPAGMSYAFAGSYENQVHASRTLSVVLPAALFIILFILYLHFRSLAHACLVFSSVFVAWAGGFILLWLYGREGFLDFDVLGVNMAELFQVHPINLSVAVWVGFLALFGICTDDNVLMSTYLQQSFAESRPTTREEIREAVVAAGKRRIRPCLMTTATTLLALLPVMTSQGRGSDVMVPMALPSFGGLTIETITLFVVPVVYCLVMELRAGRAARAP